MRQALLILATLASGSLAAPTVPQSEGCIGLEVQVITTACSEGDNCIEQTESYSECTDSNEAGPSTAQSGARCSLHNEFTAYADKLYIGVATDDFRFQEELNEQLIIDNMGQLTAENSMKWDSTEPVEGQFNFTRADTLMAFATANNMLVRGHAALWHKQLPDWVNNITDAAHMEEAVRNHIFTVMDRYKGRIYAWDVVNEIIEEDGSFRISPFSTLLNDTFVRLAFETAKLADPAAKLYINDFNLDLASYSKTKSLIERVVAWKAEGIPIDGIGSQTHLTNLGPGFSPDVREALQALCAVVDECAITELDIAGAGPGNYSEVVSACVEVGNCVGVTVWGVRDNESWMNGSEPLLFDDEARAKGAYNAVCDVLEGVEGR